MSTTALKMSTMKTKPTDLMSSIENRIADSLVQHSAFEGDLTANELIPIFCNVLVVLVQQQPFTLGTVLCEVEHMHVEIDDGEIHVHCALEIKRPIIATLIFDYTLENTLDADVHNLRLKNDHVGLQEKTRRFDLAAKTALAAINVGYIARHELSDPARIILKTLPSQLAEYGYKGKPQHIELDIGSDNTLHVNIVT